MDLTIRSGKNFHSCSSGNFWPKPHQASTTVTTARMLKIQESSVLRLITFSPSLHRSQILRDLSPMQVVAAEFSGYAGNHLRSSSYGVSANRERSRHSEATAEFRCFFERRVYSYQTS